MEDHSYYKPKNPNPREDANLLSVFTLFYTFSTFSFGYRKTITEDDIYETFSEHKCSNLGNAAVELWEEELNRASESKTKASLNKLLTKLLIKDYLLISAGIALNELVIRAIQVYFLGELILCYSEPNEDRKPYTSAVAVIVCSLVYSLLTHPIHIGSFHIALKIRVIFGSLIYRKVLKLSKPALAQATPGQILNLISNDATIFDRITFTSQYLWVGPLQVIVFFCLMYNEVGATSLFGVVLLAIFIPLYFLLARLTTKFRLKSSTRRDRRLRLMNEIIQAVNVIKMYAWEKSFARVIAKIRKREIHAIKLGLYIKSVYLVGLVFHTTAVFVTILAYVLLNQNLNAKLVFIITNSLYVICGTLTVLFPQAMIFLSEIFVSMDRMATFLLSDETRLVSDTIKGNSAVKIQSGAAKWDKSLSQCVLSSLNFEVEHGNLTAVIGSVGSGKSSMLNLILGELQLSTGNLSVNGTVSYASQEPWVFSSTIRQNILFGSEMNETRYNDVIKCCALERDLKLFPSGDKTFVGEKGTSLSGGQKARIGLARAIYREADIYLLDDPLSAVDTQVGKHIFEECIQRYLKDKTVILVTHQLQYLKYVNYIIVVDNGVMVAKGNRSDLEKSGFDFVKYLEHIPEDSVDSIVDTNEVETKPLLNLETETESADQPTADRKFIQFETYKGYLYASKSWLVLTVSILCFLITQFLFNASYYLLTYWVNMEQNGMLTNDYKQRYDYIYVYTGITIASIIFALLRSLYFVNLAMKSSKILHDTMFKNVVYATLNFFHSNTSGVILNRFSKDLSTVDEMVPNAVMTAVQTILNILGIYSLICFVNPWFLIPTALMVVILYYLRRYYLSTNLSILRVEGHVRGPLYAHVNTSLQGLSTIRAFQKEEVLTQEFYHLQDLHSSALYMSMSTSKAFGYWIDLAAVAYIAIITIYYTFNGDSHGGNVGLAITQAMQLIGLLAWGVVQITEVENYMISIERILDYNSIPEERNAESLPENKPSADWPSCGKITFKDLHLRYSKTTPYVLNNLNFVISPLEKVGIVGRTGAGKSSIIAALFQLNETEGSIIIDDVNIHRIGLRDLRLKMSIIPQDPALFSGSIRSNLDPFHEYDDELLWKALEEVRLKNVVNKLNSGLSFEISQDGSNFSVGQRQLICLARAIVRNNKILILDEATANVDLETDEIIQETIQKNFCNCTVLTVAHRLNTIMDSDKVLVMDAGVAVEFDHPYVLLQNKNGAFYNLVQQTEKTMANALTQIAKKNYENRQ